MYLIFFFFFFKDPFHCVQDAKTKKLNLTAHPETVTIFLSGSVSQVLTMPSPGESERHAQAHTHTVVYGESTY